MAQADKDLKRMLGYKSDRAMAEIITKQRGTLFKGMNQDKIYLRGTEVEALIDKAPKTQWTVSTEKLQGFLIEHWSGYLNAERLDNLLGLSADSAFRIAINERIDNPVRIMTLKMPNSIMLVFDDMQFVRSTLRDPLDELQEYVQNFRGNVLVFCSSEVDAQELNASLDHGNAEGFSIFVGAPKDCPANYIGFRQGKMPWQLMMPVQMPDQYLIMEDFEARQITGHYLNKIDPYVPGSKPFQQWASSVDNRQNVIS